jgi:hypothetical protein
MRALLVLGLLALFAPAAGADGIFDPVSTVGDEVQTWPATMGSALTWGEEQGLSWGQWGMDQATSGASGAGEAALGMFPWL